MPLPKPERKLPPAAAGGMGGVADKEPSSPLCSHSGPPRSGRRAIVSCLTGADVACPGCHERVYARLRRAMAARARAGGSKYSSRIKGAREWCSADPGPPKTGVVSVPGLQRTAGLLLHLLAQQCTALRCARDIPSIAGTLYSSAFPPP